jgi:hypothetical protein
MDGLPVILGLMSPLGATPITYAVLISGLVAVAVGFVIVLRRGWGQSGTLQKCAMLSLLFHLLLAGLAMTIRIVSGAGNGATGVPVQVRIVADIAPLAAPLEPVAAPPLLAPNEVEAPLISQDSESAAATELPPVTAAEPTEPVESPEFVESRPNTAEVTSSTTIEAPTQTPQTARQEPTDIARQVALPATPYQLRSAADRLAVVESQGGNRQTEASVAAALDWLARAQSSDGRWDAERHGAGIERRLFNENRYGAGRDADTGVSALAILAFLGAGHSHLDGEYRQQVERGIDFLIRQQAPDGNLYGGAGLYAQMYCHSMATFALAEAMAMTGDRRLFQPVSKAAAFSIRAQHPSNGGWRYDVGNRGDTSQLGWQLMALSSAEQAGISIPLQTWTGAERFLRTVRRGDAGGLASYLEYGPASTSMTAEALYCRSLVSAKLGGSLDSRAAVEATRQILTELPNRRLVNVYYWYYATLALHQRQYESEFDAYAWRLWNESLTDVLLAQQLTSGGDAGSWDPDSLWGGHGGRVYSTAMSAMCLEVYYRYAAPMDDIAARSDSPSGSSR